jgi:hypothetical protein
VGGQHHAPAALPPGKTRYPLYSSVKYGNKKLQCFLPDATVKPMKDNGKETHMILRRRRRASLAAEFNPSSSPQTMTLRKVVPKTQTMTHLVDSAINKTTIGIHRTLDCGMMKSTLVQDAVKDSSEESTLTKI